MNEKKKIGVISRFLSGIKRYWKGFRERLNFNDEGRLEEFYRNLKN